MIGNSIVLKVGQEYWKNSKINDIKRQIKEAITIEDIRKYILNKED